VLRPSKNTSMTHVDARAQAARAHVFELCHGYDLSLSVASTFCSYCKVLDAFGANGKQLDDWIGKIPTTHTVDAISRLAFHLFLLAAKIHSQDTLLHGAFADFVAWPYLATISQLDLVKIDCNLSKRMGWKLLPPCPFVALQRLEEAGAVPYFGCAAALIERVLIQGVECDASSLAIAAVVASEVTDASQREIEEAVFILVVVAPDDFNVCFARTAELATELTRTPRPRVVRTPSPKKKQELQPAPAIVADCAKGSGGALCDEDLKTPPKKRRKRR
jgi:hypothetical protein